MAKKNMRKEQEDTERGESWDSEAQADETRHGNRGDMDREQSGQPMQPMPPKSREPRQPQKKK